MAKIGVWIFEGLSVAGAYIMGDMKGGLAYRGGQGQKIGSESPYTIIDADLDSAGKIIKGSGPGDRYGGSSKTDYGTAQKRMLGVLERSKALPGDFTIWTAHERGH
jgi:hypothetical protein